MNQAHEVVREVEGGGASLVFWCPGCREMHGVWTKTPNGLTGGLWTWNGDKVQPTFSPSILVRDADGSTRCHSFVRAGMIQYLNDCKHRLAGQTVPLPADPINQF